MAISLFDLFSVGVGPSSSHTVGSMRAAQRFVSQKLIDDGELDRLSGIQVELFGSLSATGAGHGSFTAILLGLEGWAADELIAQETYYSVGGGFVVAESDDPTSELSAETTTIPYPFRASEELFNHCERTGLAVSQIMLANECVRRSEQQVLDGIWHLWEVMEACKNSALEREGTLPGGLNVKHRAPGWHAKLWQQDPDRSHAYWQEWVNLVALAVNEENASGGRVVTAPTNGAAGIIPAVGFYATHYGAGASFADQANLRHIVTTYLLTAAAIGVLYKEQASISGAEVGCQGEVGSASSMAAAGLCEVLGGTPAQVENAAEIAMEHNLGLTCDPISGLVQVPCIERDAIAATKAVNAARMSLMGDGEHRVSLDEVITTMAETGKDMSHKYKETALGGLAVNVVEC